MKKGTDVTAPRTQPTGFSMDFGKGPFRKGGGIAAGTAQRSAAPLLPSAPREATP